MRISIIRENAIICEFCKGKMKINKKEGCRINLFQKKSLMTNKIMAKVRINKDRLNLRCNNHNNNK